jgi:hypothetical protein
VLRTTIRRGQRFWCRSPVGGRTGRCMMTYARSPQEFRLFQVVGLLRPEQDSSRRSAVAVESNVLVGSVHRNHSCGGYQLVAHC